MDRHGRKRRHGIHNQQRTQFVRDLSVGVYSGDHSGRRLSMRESHNLDLLALARAAHILRVHRLPVRRLHLHDSRRRPRRNLVHAFGKNAVDRHDAFIPFFQRIQHRRFNPARSRRRKRHGDPVFCLKNLPHQDLRLIHAPLEPWVHVPHQRRSHRAVDARIDGRRSGRQHQPHRRIEFANVLRHDVLPFFFVRLILRSNLQPPANARSGTFPATAETSIFAQSPYPRNRQFGRACSLEPSYLNRQIRNFRGCKQFDSCHAREEYQAQRSYRDVTTSNVFSCARLLALCAKYFQGARRRNEDHRA